MADVTEQPPATPAGAGADYHKAIRVKASLGELFDALTSVSGLEEGRRLREEMAAHKAGAASVDGEA
jgi:hypothetical protein